MTTDMIHMEAEGMATCVTGMHKYIEEGKGKSISAESLDEALGSQNSSEAEKKRMSRTEEILTRYAIPAQETEYEREYRQAQIDYERGEMREKNIALAKSITTLAEKNFANRVLAAACDFTEMADKHPRAKFIATFGSLIEEELKADPTKPSKRLASFTTAYFWKEANWQRIVRAVRPETTRAELMEFFALPLNSALDKKVIDCLPDRITGAVVAATSDKDNMNIRFDFKQKYPYVSLEESDKLEDSINASAQKNFTNRLLTSTAYYQGISNPFNIIRSIREFAPALNQELEADPTKPSPLLATLVTEQGIDEKDARMLIDKVTPKTTKKELKEFLTTRETWSTGLRMIDYLNHHVVTEMARFLPEKDKLDLWALKPEMIEEFNVESSLRQFSPQARKELINTIGNPTRRKTVEENIDNKLRGLHVSVGLMGGGNVDPNTLELYAKFGTVRTRRICSHEDNRRFFPTQEHFRSSY